MAAGPLAATAGAQATAPPTPFPRPLLAFVPVPATGPADPALAVQTVAAGEGNGVGTGGDRRVTVGFASAFPLPSESYRVSVVWGVPGGAQTRASFESRAGSTTGVVETSPDGRSWNDAGATNATFNDDSVAIDAALGDAAPGAGLWAEAQLGADPARLVTTPVFSLDAVVGRTTDGGLPAASWGTPATSGPTAAPPVAFGTPAPTLTIDNQALIVTDPAPAPTRLAGQAVTSVVDEITFMPGYTPSGTVTGVVRLDRTAGTIRALSGSTGLPEDRTGDGSWIVTGLPAPPTSSTAPVQVTLDLAGVTRALGVPLDADGTGLGLRRKVTVADGTVVVGLPVTATVGWFQTAAVPTEAPPGTLAAEVTTGADETTANAVPALIGAGAVAAVLVVAAIVLVVRRRRRRVAGVQADLFGAEAVGSPLKVAPLERSSMWDREPVPEPEPEPEPRQEPEPEPELSEPEPESPPRAGGRSPADVLAALDAQVDDLSARVERLGRTEDDAPPAPGPAER